MTYPTHDDAPVGRGAGSLAFEAGEQAYRYDDDTTPGRDGRPTVTRIHRVMARVRAWMCDRMCGGAYDHRAGRIVDAAIAERDRLHEIVADLANRLGGRAP